MRVGIDQQVREGFLLGSDAGLDMRRRLARQEAEIAAIERETAALRQRIRRLADQVGQGETIWQGDDGWHH